MSSLIFHKYGLMDQISTVCPAVGDLQNNDELYLFLCFHKYKSVISNMHFMKVSNKIFDWTTELCESINII